MELIDGKKISAEIKNEIAQEVEIIKEQGGKTPHLAVIIVGNDGGSEVYVANKVKSCEQVGFKSTKIALPEDTTQEKLMEEIQKLNSDPDVDGFIVQLPLPDHLNEEAVLEAVDHKKDVDGFHAMNIGRMVSGLPAFLPATPAGIVELLKRYDIKVSGKNVVVLGRSNLVGRPISILLSQKGEFGNATVTVCHSRTSNLQEVCSSADILIAAIGQPEFVKSDMVKDGAVVIDVGTTRMKSDKTKSGWKLYGDVDFNDVNEKCSYITPVPGGVGPMTIVSLLLNTLKAAKKEIYK